MQDSCSDDGTQEWLPHDPRVTAFIEKDRGMYDAVNRGFRRAKVRNCRENSQHVFATVVLLFGSMAYIPERFADDCNDRRLTEGQLLRSASVKRKPCGSPTKNGGANLTPLRFCRYFTDNDAGLVTSYRTRLIAMVSYPFGLRRT